MMRPRSICRAFALLVLCLSLAAISRGLGYPSKFSERRSSAHSFDATRSYITKAWGILTRYPDRCETFADPKSHGQLTLYLPAGAAIDDSLAQLRARCNLKLENLPSVIARPGGFDPSKLKTQGLLYLKNPYVVPGGQFNEMYGWDSYFIVRGLILDGRVELAKGMVENFIYEIDNYGAVLNANRTYYLTRSQPQFLTSMILAVYRAEDARGRSGDLGWLRRAYAFAVRDHDQWTQAPHLAADTGLSRYFDYGEGPAPEMASDTSGYYQNVARYFAEHGGVNERYLQTADQGRAKPGIQGSIFTVGSPCRRTSTRSPEGCKPFRKVALTAAYYKGDRSMRESGFDVSFRFGPFGAATDQFAPVCLNSLLYKTETDLAEISKLLGRLQESAAWAQKASDRRRLIDKYLWDEAGGEYFDYDFVNRKISDYEYATTFYPLWAGLASEQQAKAVMRNLSRFLKPGGLVMSGVESGAQWDYPYGWAPIQLLACEGMRRYGFHTEADTVSYDFISMVMQNFTREGTVREKYDVVTRSSETHITRGYRQNVVGFGWTNATFAVLASELSRSKLESLKSQ